MEMINDLELSEQMYKDGFKNILSIDISSNVINKMRARAIKKNMDLKCILINFHKILLLLDEVMDATNMDYEDD
jgi:hypothetical protein